LLIASPGLFDPNFRRTVVLVTEHTDEGAAGLVLNRPSPASVSELVPQLEELVEDEEQVWLGGPVQPNAVLVLGEFVDPEAAAVPLFGSLGFPALDEPEDVVPATTRRRVFAGYAGWGAGQLETELERADEADREHACNEAVFVDELLVLEEEALWALEQLALGEERAPVAQRSLRRIAAKWSDDLGEGALEGVAFVARVPDHREPAARR